MANESVIEVLLLTLVTISRDLITNAVHIENMHVPELVESGSSDITLCCQYSQFDENYSMHWLFNGNKISSKEWNSFTVKISETQGFQKTLDPSNTPSTMKQSLLSFQRVAPHMSGNYTCQLNGASNSAQLTKHMFVFSPENDLTLKTEYPNKHGLLDIKCTAGGLYPKPEINLEVDNRPVSNHVQRVWWKEDSYTVEGSARLLDISEGKHEVTCRLYLPRADYTAMVKKIIHVGSAMCCGSDSIASTNILILCAAVISFTVQSDHLL